MTNYLVPQDITKVYLFLKILIRIRSRLILKRNLYLIDCWSKTESYQKRAVSSIFPESKKQKKVMRGT